ncbi:MAG: hypothetical protein KDD66_15235 [Bdellovibrionales bacterium]|nr:hypothetical protein [Bdellovibrionales bacterium]
MAKNQILNIFTALIMLSAASCQSSSWRETYKSSLPVLKPGDPVIAFGDEMTKGDGAKKDESYPSQLTLISGLAVINAGKAGETTRSLLSHMSTDLRNFKPKLAIVIIGANDFAKDEQTKHISENLNTILTHIRRSRTTPVLVAIPTTGLVRADSSLYYDVAKKHRTPLISGLLKDILGDSELTSGENKLNAKGYAKLAEGINNYLKENGAIE